MSSINQLQLPNQLCSAVFENERILEKILEHAVRNPKQRHDNLYKSLSSDLALPLRQVSRLWLESISKIFQRFQEPLLHISISFYTYSDTLVALAQKLEEHISFIEDNNHWIFGIPLKLSLVLMTLESDQEVIVRVLQLLCRTFLIKFDIKKQINGFPLILPSTLQYPHLKEIRLDSAHRGSGTNQLTAIVQSFLDASPNLETFLFEENCLPLSPNWSYPRTLKRLAIDYFTNIPEPQQVPDQLTHLTIYFSRENQSEVKERLFNILTSCRNSLKELYLNCIKIDDDEVEEGEELTDVLQINLSNGPQLPKLKVLGIKAHQWNPIKKDRIIVYEQFPHLEHLSLIKDRCGFHNFVEGFIYSSANSTYPSVRSLDITLWCQPDWDPFLLKGFQRLQSTLQHLTNLKLTLEVGNIGVLRTVFLAMKQLRTLSVDLRGYISETGRSMEEVYAVFIGCSRRIVEKIRDDPRLGNAFLEDANRSRESYKYGASIREMTNLESFSLSCLTGQAAYEMFVLSGVLFNLGFMLAPSLRYLYIENFIVLQEVVDMWEEHGGTIQIERVL